MNDPAIQVENLVKDFGSFRAVDNISFVVPRGKIVGFLGPNGAGKTTTIHMLLGITAKTAGKISYFGQDFSKHKQAILQRINFASAFNTLQGRITVWENLKIFALLYESKNYKKKLDDLIEYFEISDLLNKRYIDLSSGQKTRVNIVKSLINDPEIVLMDEPTASLDPDIADKTLSLIENLKEDRNLTILFTSHNMNEITRICDDVVFLDHGKIVAHDTPIELTKRIKTAEVQITFDGDKKKLESYLSGEQINFAFIDQDLLFIKTDEKSIPKMIFEISKKDVEITDIEINKPTLEDVFLQIARRESYEN